MDGLPNPSKPFSGSGLGNPSYKSRACHVRPDRTSRQHHADGAWGKHGAGRPGRPVSAAGFPAPVGAVAEIERQAGPPLRAEVVGFRDDLTRALSVGRPGRRAAGQPRPAGPHRPLAPRGAGTAGPGDRRRGPRHRRPAAAGAGRSHVAVAGPARALPPPAHRPAAGDRGAGDRRTVDAAARGSGWGFSPAPAWARACCWG